MPTPLLAEPGILERHSAKPARLSPRQVEDLDFLRAHPLAAALWHEVGVGKTHPLVYRTLELIAPGVDAEERVARLFKATPDGRSLEEQMRRIKAAPEACGNAGRTRALVVVKRSLFGQWKEKIASIIRGYRMEHPEWGSISVGVLQGGKKPEQMWGRGYSNVPDVVLVNYDYIPSLLKEERGGDLSGWLAGLIPSLLVLDLDEAHKIKGFRGFRSNKGLRARLLNRIAPLVPYRYAISGSPVLNPNSSDVWGIYHFLDPGIFGPTRWQFVQEFFYDISKDRKYEMLRLKPGMASEMSRRLYLIARRITKKDCPKGEFPEPRRIRYDVDLPPSVREAYDQLEATGIAEVEGQPVTRMMLLGRLMALQQIASGFIIEEGVPRLIDASHKVHQFAEIMEEIEGQPVVVWAHFRHEIEHLDRMLAEMRVPHSIAYGGMTKSAFDGAVEAFVSGAVNVIVGHPAAVGAGMDFQRAQHSIRFSRSFTLEDFEQSEGRTNRAFSEFDETIHHEIVAAGTRDEYVYENLIEKKDLSSSITLDDLIPVERNA